MKIGFFSKSKSNYSSIMTVEGDGKTASLSVKKEEFIREEISSSEIEEMQSENASWLKERKNPFYKDLADFLISGSAGYFISVGISEISGINNIENKLLATTIFTFLPYFTGRLTSKALSIWNSEPSVEASEFKELIPYGIGSIGSAAIGSLLGLFKTFNTLSYKETAFLGGIGMMSGKIIESTVKYYSNRNCNETDIPVRFVPR